MGPTACIPSTSDSLCDARNVPRFSLADKSRRPLVREIFRQFGRSAQLRTRFGSYNLLTEKWANGVMRRRDENIWRSAGACASAPWTISLSRLPHRSLHPRDRRRIPPSGERLALGAIQAHGQIEPALWRRQPICFVVLAGALVLEIEVERSVSVVMERHPGTDRLPVEIVGISEPIRIVHGNGPESVYRRRGPFLEVDRVFVRSVERLAGLIGEIERIDRVFRQVRAEADPGDDRPLEIVVAIDAHRIGIHRPAVHDVRERRQLPVHELLPIFHDRITRPFYNRITLRQSNHLTRLQAELLHLRTDRLVPHLTWPLSPYPPPNIQIPVHPPASA